MPNPIEPATLEPRNVLREILLIALTGPPIVAATIRAVESASHDRTVRFRCNVDQHTVNLDRQIVFSPFRLDAANERLYELDRVVPLRPKTFAAQRHLVNVSDAVLKGCWS
jgi:hypothetical protein